MTRKWPAELNPRLTSGKVALPTDKKRDAEIDFSFSAASKIKDYTGRFEHRSKTGACRKEDRQTPGWFFMPLPMAVLQSGILPGTTGNRTLRMHPE